MKILFFVSFFLLLKLVQKEKRKKSTKFEQIFPWIKYKNGGRHKAFHGERRKKARGIESFIHAFLEYNCRNIYTLYTYFCSFLNRGQTDKYIRKGRVRYTCTPNLMIPLSKVHTVHGSCGGNCIKFLAEWINKQIREKVKRGRKYSFGSKYHKRE